MNTCSCGNLIDARFTQCPRCEAVQVLGVEADATEKEIRSAYRLLAKAWSPENFRDDQKLKKAAEDKLKDVNTAFYFLTSTSSERYREERPCYVSHHKISQEPSSEDEPKPREASANDPEPVLNPDAFSLLPAGQETKAFFRILQKFKTPLKIVALLLAILAGRLIWTALKTQTPNSEQVASANGSGQPGVAKAPEKSFLDEIKQDLQSLNPLNSAPATDQQTEQTEPQNAKEGQPRKTHATSTKAQPESGIIKPYVTIGSTRNEVLAQQGAPTASSEDKLVYGKSELYFKNGSVAGWRIDPASSPIRVKLWPQSTIDPSPDYFTIGSSKDVVLEVQGTPTAFIDGKFEYGGSEVYFRDNRVVSWKNDPASTPLRAK